MRQERRVRAAILALLTAGSSACGTTATIHRPTGYPIEGVILGSQGESLVIETPEGELLVDKSEISDIDHPGNVAGTVGTIFAANGALTLVASLATGSMPLVLPCQPLEGGFICGTGSLLETALWLALAIDGFSTWSRSRRATELTIRRQSAPTPSR